MKGRIWILNHYASLPDRPGGTRHYDVGRQLVRMGWDVTVFASSFDHLIHRETLPHGVTYDEQVHDGLKFVRVKTASYNRNNWRRVLDMLVYTVRVLRLTWTRQPPDVIIGSSVHLLAAWAGYVLSRHHGARFLFEVRDLWPETLIGLGKMSRKHPFIIALSHLERFLYARAEYILFLLPRASQYASGLGVDLSKCVYLPNGVDLEKFDSKNNSLPPDVDQTLARIEASCIAVYTGTIGLVNHLDIMIDAATSLWRNGVKSVHFLFVGEGPYKDALSRRVLDDALGNVTFIPAIAKEHIPALLRRCQVGLLCTVPSPVYKYGISPNKLFDYMAAGIPTLVVGESEGSPLVESGGGFQLEFGDVAGVARILMDVAKEPAIAQERGRRARAYVEANHSTVVLARRLDSILA